MCYLWQPELIWGQVITNSLIALAYFAIPVLLLYFIRRRPDIPNPLLFTLFSIFIVACGTHHIMTIVTIWKPMYWTATFVDAITALASIGTAAVMAPLMPRLLRSGTVEHYLEAMSKAVLEDKNEDLEAANNRLERMNADLQQHHPPGGRHRPGAVDQQGPGRGPWRPDRRRKRARPGLDLLVHRAPRRGRTPDR